MQPDCNNGAPAAALPPSGREAPASSARWLDRMGIGVSITCAVHCVGAALLAAAPAFAASASPGLGEQFEWAEGALLWMALAIGSLALVPAYVRVHRRPLPLALFASGVVLLAASRMIDADGFEVGGTVAGVVLIASAHILNLRASPHTHAH